MARDDVRKPATDGLPEIPLDDIIKQQEDYPDRTSDNTADEAQGDNGLDENDLDDTEDETEAED